MAENRVRYICPICDQELGVFKHFCKNCKSYVREPWRFTGSHLPNEGHDGCHPSQTYMNPRTGSTSTYHQASKSLAGKNNSSKQYTYNRTGQSSASTGRGEPYQNRHTYQKPQYYDSRNTSTSRRQKKKKVSLFFVILFFYYLFQTFIGYFRG